MTGQLARFVLVGGINTAVHYALYLLLVPYLPYTAAFVVAFALATVGSFFLNALFTYRTPITWRKFLRFPSSTLVNLIVSTLVLSLLVEKAHVDSRVAPLLAAAVAVPVTFVVARRVMLSERQ
ncbi:GtrA family protein [Streptomyces sp. MA15]|uniref:GtrA family protein n=1 Tax=Streptomyces sp. MA15 TaxID=3055061 RepID=UPI0025AEEA47|nr:GtrA family protein [Streptomyces sp. MA15]MDN3270381.1 GtrA family protein [Streptomyces sp. MA15]